MLRFFLPAISILLSFPLSAQSIPDTVKAWFAAERYSDITSWIRVLDADTLDDQTLYYTGLSFFVLEQDQQALKYLDNSISKNPFFAPAYYYAGLCHSQLGSAEDALTYWKAANRLDPRNPDYPMTLADAYLRMEEPDSVLYFAGLATQTPRPPARAYVVIAGLFIDLGAAEKALDVYYDCLQEAVQSSEGYTFCLYNIGYLELERNEPANAALVLEMLLEMEPQDFEGVELLIQSYMKQEKYFEATPWIDYLHRAFAADMLTGSLKDRYLMEWMPWKGGRLSAYEHFARPDSNHTAYTFYHTNKEGAVVETILVRYEPGISGKDRYLLVRQKDGTEYLYSDRSFRLTRNTYFRIRDWVRQISDNMWTPVRERPAGQP